jgi:glycosyltransferase involved in cell wall biosynthesis
MGTHMQSSPFLASVTLTGNSESLIAEALQSVLPWVDVCLVVDTGATDGTISLAQRVAGNKYRGAVFPWGDDFAAARNFGLTAAADTGARWAVMLDTDERIDIGRVDIRRVLETAADTLLLVSHDSQTYAKERFFRMPAPGCFVGPTHEYFAQAEGTRGYLAGVRFREESKSVAEYQGKFERDVVILSRCIRDDPDNARWYYYLGDTYRNLGRHMEAIESFRRCSELSQWDEEAAWACYRAAESWAAQEKWSRAVETCAGGMTRHAGLAELPWLSAYASWQAGNAAQAAYWAQAAIALGRFVGVGNAIPRHGFRYPPALYEGPYDVLRFALRVLGDDAGADEAERLYRQARAARELAGD